MTEIGNGITLAIDKGPQQKRAHVLGLFAEGNF